MEGLHVAGYDVTDKVGFTLSGTHVVLDSSSSTPSLASCILVEEATNILSQVQVRAHNFTTKYSLRSPWHQETLWHGEEGTLRM